MRSYHVDSGAGLSFLSCRSSRTSSWCDPTVVFAAQATVRAIAVGSRAHYESGQAFGKVVIGR